MSVQIFVQSEALTDVEVLELPDIKGFKELRSACLGLLPASVEVESFLLFVEDRDEDGMVEAIELDVEEIRVHLHRLKEIDVRVRYGGREVRRSFRPSATIARIKRWSAQHLGIPPADAAELMLQVAGTSERPDDDIHVGTLVKAPHHSITFDLVPSPRVNG
jgi:hypothetical protein